MGKKESKPMLVIRYLFHIMIFLVLIFFIAAQCLLPSETNVQEESTRLQVQWYRVLENGEKVKVEVPGKCEAEWGEKIILEAVLPEKLENHKYLCFLTSNNDMKVYIDGVLRGEYDTKESRPFGKYSVHTHFFVPVDVLDSGKELRIEMQTYSAYSGVFREIIYADKAEIWKNIVLENGFDFMVAILLILCGIISITVTILFSIRYHKLMEIGYLGWSVILLAFWMIAQSDLRQLVFSNISAASSMTFFSLMLFPIPTAIYMDAIQNQRYRKSYLFVCIAAMFNFFVCVGMQLAEYRDFAENILAIFSGSILVLLFVIINTAKDYKKGYLKEYKMVAAGIICVGLSGVVQMFQYFQRENTFNTSVLCMGLLALMVMAFMQLLMEVKDMEQARQKAIAASESKACFLANMSHEIRTPINAVLGMDEMILNESHEETILSYAADIQSAGRSLLALINDILDFSKIESGKMEILPVEYELFSLLNDSYHMIAARANDKHLKVTFCGDQTLPSRLFGDEIRIRQILVNLLTNAVKYTEKGEVCLTVSGERTDSDTLLLQLEVKDTGSGISEENKKKLFQSFQRIDEINNRNIEGTGLGLTIVRQLVDLMDGTITVESEYGKGSVFVVTIPQKIVSEKPVGDFSETFKKGHSSQVKRHRESFHAPDAKILVVDDVEMNLKVIKGLLKRTKIQIDTAVSGKQCLHMIEEKEYNIIFLDHMMPGMDGIETMHQMNAMQNHKNKRTPVIMLTANAMEGAKEEYIKEGFCDYLSKPVQVDKLERKILQYLPKELVTLTEDTPKQEQEVKELTLKEKLPFLDVDTGMMYCGQNEEFYRSILTSYHTDNSYDALQEFYQKEDWENYRIKIHSLKSTSLSVGAAELSGQAKKLEQAVKEQRMEFVLQNHAKVMENYQKLLRKLEEADKIYPAG